MGRPIAQRKTRFHLPGWELVGPGLRDLENGVESSVEALIVLIGAPRLRELGFKIPATKIEMPTHKLYQLLAREDSDSAHFRYNDLVLRLVSFENAAECLS